MEDPDSHFQEKKQSKRTSDSALFDHLHDTVSSKFHCIRPLDHRDNPAMMQAIDGLYSTLRCNGYQLIPLKEISQRGDMGFVSCTCQLYLMRNWCHHACVFVFSRGIITGYPPTIDPRPAFARRRRGKPGHIPKKRMLEQEVEQTELV